MVHHVIFPHGAPNHAAGRGDAGQLESESTLLRGLIHLPVSVAAPGD